jgi:hypothetical protein
MVRFAREKRFFLIVAAYTALSVLGAFSFAAAEPYRAVNAAVGSTTQGRLSSALGDFAAQHPLADPTLNAQSGGTRSSPVSMGLQRLTFLAASPLSGKPYSRSPLIAGAIAQYGAVKNTILLKLRI